MVGVVLDAIQQQLLGLVRVTQNVLMNRRQIIELSGTRSLSPPLLQNAFGFRRLISGNRP